jgi:hypothetical protein
VYQSGNFIDSDKQPNSPLGPNGADTGWAAFGFGSLGSPVQTLTHMATPFAIQGTLLGAPEIAVAGNGVGISLVGHHEILIPLIAAAVIEPVPL